MICSNCKHDVLDSSLYCEQCGASLIGSDMQITRNDFTLKQNNAKSLDFKNGDSFGERYKIISELGKGGMGQVFKAHDRELNIDVALKMIRSEFLLNKRMISRFKQEILLAREITHENVSRIYDFGEVEGTKFISMEFISGRTLKEIVKDDGPIEVEKAIEISKAICSGLEAAHKKEIIHRDLKPQNIMIDDNDHVYITDFGLAKSVRREDFGHTGIVIGTPQYIPPELWKGERADKRSDIYSLGIIMYEMVAGEELFQSDSDYGYLQKHVSEKPVFPPAIKDKLPSFFKQLILRCLAKEREARYQDCGEMHRDIKDRLYSTGTFLNEFERSIKKTGPSKIGFSLLLILIISFVGSFILKKGPPVQKKRSVAILYFKNLSGMKDLDHFSYSLAELLNTDLGQSKYIKVLSEEKVSNILQESNYLRSSFIDEKLFKDLGDQVSVNFFVQGSFINSGDNLRITMKLRDSDSGEILSTDYVDATMDNIFPAIDRLTTGLKRRLNLTENEIFADIDNEVESITTSSQEALNFYITGKRLFNERNFKESLVEYQKAIDIDPEFAMSYRNMAWSYALLEDWDNRKKYFEKTIQFVDKLSIREKYLIYGDYYGEKQTTYQKALDSYQKILDVYPDDIEANFHKGLFYRIFEEWDKGISHLSKVLNEDKSNILALDELIICHEGKEQFKQAEEILAEYEAANGDLNLVEVLRIKYELYILENNLSQASLIVDQQNVLSKQINSEIKYNKSTINILNDNFINAEKLMNSIKKNSDIKYIPDMTRLKYFFHYNGKFAEFEKLLKEEIGRVVNIGEKNSLKFELVYFYLGTGQIEKAIEELKNVDKSEFKNFPAIEEIYLTLEILGKIASGNLNFSDLLLEKLEFSANNSIFRKQSLRRYYHLMAKLKEKRGKIKEAEEFYLKTLALSKHRKRYHFTIVYIYNSALFYYNRNNNSEAEKYFLQIQELTFGRLYRGDLFAKSFYYLGKIYQRRGWTGKAIKSYKRFYNMWKDGDPQFVGKYLTDTEKQLVILKHRI